MNDILLILICITIGIYCTLIYNERFLIGFVIITLLTVPSELGTTLRLFIHIIDLFILFYLFIKEYGIDFGRFPIVPKPVFYFLILLYISMILSTLFSQYPVAGLVIITRTSVFFLYIYLFYGIIRSEQIIKTVLFSLFVTGIVLTGGVIVDFINQGGSIAYFINPIKERDFGIYSNFNVTGEYAVILFPILVIALFIDRYRNKRIFIWICGAIILICCILIASRAAVFGIFLGAAIVLFFKNKKAFTILSSAIIIIVLINLIFRPFESTLDIALRLNEGLSQHDHFWDLAVNMVNDNPVLGIGPGAYPLVEFNYIPVLLDSYSGQVMIQIHNVTMDDLSNNSHNFYLSMLSEMGIPGLISAIYLLAVFFKISFQTYNKYRNFNEEIRLIIIAIIAVGICLSLRGFIESNGIFSFGKLSNDLPFWLLFVILISYFNERTKAKL